MCLSTCTCGSSQCNFCKAWMLPWSPLPAKVKETLKNHSRPPPDCGQGMTSYLHCNCQTLGQCNAAGTVRPVLYSFDFLLPDNRLRTAPSAATVVSCFNMAQLASGSRLHSSSQSCEKLLRRRVLTATRPPSGNASCFAAMRTACGTRSAFSTTSSIRPT